MTFSFHVMPAKAGIQSGKNDTWSLRTLDPRLRGGDAVFAREGGK